MRWTSSGLNRSVGPIAKLACDLLACLFLCRWLNRARRWFLADRRHQSRRGCCGRRWTLLFRKALLKGFHQIDDRRHMRLGNLGYLLTLELGRNHSPHVLLIFIAILLRRKRIGKTLD